MKYIQIRKNEIYTQNDCAVLDAKTGNWIPATPELLNPNIKEWFIHKVMKKHFSFGQPYCVVCGHTDNSYCILGKVYFYGNEDKQYLCIKNIDRQSIFKDKKGIEYQFYNHDMYLTNSRHHA